MEAIPWIGLILMVVFLIISGLIWVVAVSQKKGRSGVGVVALGLFSAVTFLAGAGLYIGQKHHTAKHSYTSIIEKAPQEDFKEDFQVLLNQAAEDIQQKLDELEKKINQEQASTNEEPEQSDGAVTMGKKIDKIREEIKEKHAARLKEKTRLEAMKKLLDEKTQETFVKDKNENLANQKQESEESELPQWIVDKVVIEQKNLEEFLQAPSTIPNEFAVSSGRFMTKIEADKQAVELAKQVIKTVLVERLGVTDVAQVISADQVRDMIRKSNTRSKDINILEGSPTTMYRQHLLVRIDDANLDSIVATIRHAAVPDRIRIASIGLLAVMLTSLVLSFVFSKTSAQPEKVRESGGKHG